VAPRTTWPVAAHEQFRARPSPCGQKIKAGAALHTKNDLHLDDRNRYVLGLE
jgi:hypothetical protein